MAVAQSHELVEQQHQQHHQQQQPHKLNGIIETDATDHSSAGEPLNLVSSQMPIRPGAAAATVAESAERMLDTLNRHDESQGTSAGEAASGADQKELLHSQPDTRPIRSISSRRRRLSNQQQETVARPSSVAASKRSSGVPNGRELTWSQDMGAATDSMRRLAVDEVDSVRLKRGPCMWEVRKTFAGHLDCVRSISMLNGGSGTQLVSGSDDGTVMVWDMDHGDKQRARRKGVMSLGHVSPVTIFRGHLAAVTCVAAADDYQYAYSAGLDSSIKEWQLDGSSENINSSFPVREFAGHSDAVWGLVLAPRRELLASVSADGTCKLWRLAGGKAEPRLSLLQGHTSRHETAQPAIPTSVSFAGDDPTHIAIGYDTGNIELRDLTTGGVAATLWKRDDGARMLLGSPLPRVTKVVCHSDSGNIVAAASTSGWVHLYDARLSKALVYPGIAAYPQAGVVATALALGRDKEIITGGSNGVVKWWDWRKALNSLCEVNAHEQKASEGVCAVVHGVDGHGTPLVVSAGADGLAKLYQSTV
ncbi:1,2-dihydroxy-3-keto-5-methylthiopentene dioxygenase [Coemansia biformis]|uniref:1,2-dihydroxy-3-keto-5-methylthiopentene dioxygenase n=1 Tax=Coemansia biformis TaxID=1286918 RepID=A0A9W8CYC1_9FUNG|nr:1,2-dihydroxy-3-keto-5-methylthiopentene dioxygenase [Coemansia biformis]